MATNLPLLSRLDNTDVFMLSIHQAYVDTTRNLAWNNSCNQYLGQPSVTAGLKKKRLINVTLDKLPKHEVVSQNFLDLPHDITFPLSMI